MSQDAPEHHDVIVVGGGVAGLGVATLLGGWRPRLEGPVPKPLDHPSLKRLVEDARDDLLSMDMRGLAEVPVSTFDVFRLLHHPQQEYRGLEAYPLRFDKGAPFDWLMLTDEPVGGLWNNVPRNQLTLSPAHWMELSAYPVARYFEEHGIEHDPNDLIRKDFLVSYYHSVPSRLAIEDNIEVGWTVESVTRGRDGEGRFRICARRRGTGEVAEFTCDYLVYAAGPRVKMRRLGVPGEETQPYVSHHYDHFDDYPGKRVMVVGGGRSADWAATELHDAGRDVTYVMRQSEENHRRLIQDSQHLPYYVRIRQILDEEDRSIETRYESRVTSFRDGGTVLVTGADGTEEAIRVDHVVVEIGGQPDYDLIRPLLPPGQEDFTLVEARDRYRFQVWQLKVHPHSFESVDVPGMYPAGYIAEGLGISVLGMHATCFPIVADIERKLASKTSRDDERAARQAAD